MAIITNIQGTDSLSASRVTLNDNFTAINNELASVTALLDPSTGDLSGVADAEVETLLVDGGAAAELAATGNTLTAATAVNGAIALNGKVSYGSTSVSSLPAANSFVHSTYLIDFSTAANPVTLNAGDSGQEIMLIADGGTVYIDYTNIAGPTVNVELSGNGTLTLRYVGTSWYIVSSFEAIITV